MIVFAINQIDCSGGGGGGGEEEEEEEEEGTYGGATSHNELITFSC